MTANPINANGSAHEKNEQRNGIPLDYVGEKLGSAIGSIWALANLPSERDSPTMLEVYPQGRSDLLQTMRYASTAYLALYNMLGAANDQALAVRLLNGSHEEIKKWLTFVASQGSVNGIESG